MTTWAWIGAVVGGLTFLLMAATPFLVQLGESPKANNSDTKSRKNHDD